MPCDTCRQAGVDAGAEPGWVLSHNGMSSSPAPNGDSLAAAQLPTPAHSASTFCLTPCPALQEIAPFLRVLGSYPMDTHLGRQG